MSCLLLNLNLKMAAEEYENIVSAVIQHLVSLISCLVLRQIILSILKCFQSGNREQVQPHSLAKLVEQIIDGLLPHKNGVYALQIKLINALLLQIEVPLDYGDLVGGQELIWIVFSFLEWSCGR